MIVELKTLNLQSPGRHTLHMQKNLIARIERDISPCTLVSRSGKPHPGAPFHIPNSETPRLSMPRHRLPVQEHCRIGMDEVGLHQ
jgi:hypothetical protein